MFFFFNDPPTTEIYTLSLHDALPILSEKLQLDGFLQIGTEQQGVTGAESSSYLAQELVAGIAIEVDRKSTRLNSSHVAISYAVFCLKKKKTSRATLVTVATRRPRSTT